MGSVSAARDTCGVFNDILHEATLAPLARGTHNCLSLSTQQSLQVSGKIRKRSAESRKFFGTFVDAPESLMARSLPRYVAISKIGLNVDAAPGALACCCSSQSQPTAVLCRCIIAAYGWFLEANSKASERLTGERLHSRHLPENGDLRWPSCAIRANILPPRPQGVFPLPENPAVSLTLSHLQTIWAHKGYAPMRNSHRGFPPGSWNGSGLAIG